MNKKILLLGGSLLIAGGMVYWYLSQNGIVKCTQYTTQTTCESAGCYWWTDNTCHNIPQGADPCPALNAGMGCYPNSTGWRKCDSITNNLCECDGTNWFLIEESSQVCYDNTKYAKCAVNQDNMVMCLPYWGQGEDECKAEYYASGCPCPPGCHCQWQSALIDGECIVKYQYTPTGGTLAVHSSEMECYGSGGDNTCIHYFDSPICGTTLTGNLYYKWGPLPFAPGGYRISTWYKGVKTDIVDVLIMIWGDWGNWGINEIFLPKKMDAIEFNCSCGGTNIHVDKFIGTLMF